MMTYVKCTVTTTTDYLILEKISNIESYKKDDNDLIHIITFIRTDLLVRQSLIYKADLFFNDFIENGFVSKDITLYEESVQAALDAEISNILSGDIEPFLLIYPQYEKDIVNERSDTYRHPKVEIAPKVLTIKDDHKAHIMLPKNMNFYNLKIRLFSSTILSSLIIGKESMIIKKRILDNYSQLGASDEYYLQDVKVKLYDAPFGYHVSEEDRELLTNNSNSEAIMKIVDKYVNIKIRIALDIEFIYNKPITESIINSIINHYNDLLNNDKSKGV
jgi:hypothetical protein